MNREWMQTASRRPVRRILFLVDRKALAAQAVREFNAFNTPKGNKFTQERSCAISSENSARMSPLTILPLA
jgi:type I site-specific restriction endonuclease